MVDYVFLDVNDGEFRISVKKDGCEMRRERNR